MASGAGAHDTTRDGFNPLAQSLWLRRQPNRILDVDGGGILMASDWDGPSAVPGDEWIPVSLTYPTVAHARRIFDALAGGGSVQMPFEKTFWSDGFGMLTDRFGTPWMINTEGTHA